MPGRVESDAGLLRSVMQNFLSNAVRYTAAGAVLVGVRWRGPDWRIDVIDTGVGIGEQHVEEIFAEFTRLGDVEVEGLGLGLALVRRIVRLLGGRIEVCSIPGKGSRFSLYLPADDKARAPFLDTIQPAQQPPKAARLRVLVVDNDEMIVEATIALLESLGHSAIGARTIAEAIDAVGDVDAALIDYHLDHGENGLDLIDQLRTRRGRLPVRLVTAENGMTMQKRATAMKVDILAKPAAPGTIEAFLAGASVTQIEA